MVIKRRIIISILGLVYVLTSLPTKVKYSSIHFWFLFESLVMYFFFLWNSFWLPYSIYVIYRASECNIMDGRTTKIRCRIPINGLSVFKQPVSDSFQYQDKILISCGKRFTGFIAKKSLSFTDCTFRFLTWEQKENQIWIFFTYNLLHLLHVKIKPNVENNCCHHISNKKPIGCHEFKLCCCWFHCLRVRLDR